MTLNKYSIKVKVNNMFSQWLSESVSLEVVDDGEVGTSKQADINAPYSQILQVIGQPPQVITDREHNDVAVIWVLEVSPQDEEPFIATVYSNDFFTAPEEITYWRIGARTPYQGLVVKLHLSGKSS